MADKKLKKYVSSLKEALETFDLKELKKWMKKYNPPLFSSFKDAGEIVQMASMCKMICNRTDMLDTDAYKKAVRWLHQHNMSGRIM